MIKKIFAFILLIVIIGGILFIAYWFFVLRSSDKFTLYRESGEVFYKRDEEEYKEMSSDEITLENGTYIKTSDGLAHIVFPDDSLMSIGKDTEIQITFEGGKTTINQIVGNTWHRIKEISSGEEYEVQTPTTLAAVRGTKFAIEVYDEQDGYTNAYSVLNNIEISQVGKENDEGILKNTQDLAEGKFATIYPFDKVARIEIIDIPGEIKNTKWFKRNVIIDKEFDKKRPGRFVKDIRHLEEIKNLESPDEISEQASSILGIEIESIDPSLEDFMSEMRGKYDISVVGDEACIHINSDYFENDLLRLEKYEPELGDDYFLIRDYLDELADFCYDNTLTQKEKEVLSEYLDLSETVDAEFGPDPEFEAVLQERLDYYLIMSEDGGKATCKRHLATTVDDIVEELTAIEEKYGVEPQVGEETRPVLTEIRNACRDGMITHEEMQKIEPLFPDKQN